MRTGSRLRGYRRRPTGGALRWSLAAVGALGLATAPAVAHAYCFTSACGKENAGSLCIPAVEGDCGEPLRWKSRCTGFAMQEAGSRDVSANQASDLVRAAFAAWTGVVCADGRPPGLVVQDLGRVACDALEYNSGAGNANIVVFRDGGWPHRSSSHNIALTTTTFDPDTGELFDADIELNSADFDLTTRDDAVAYDLESVIVHEAGHFLGLGHTDVEGATMRPVYTEGDTGLRSLEGDDIAAICALYPPKAIDETCNPLPRHGFSPACKDQQTEGTCTIASGPFGVTAPIGGEAAEGRPAARWGLLAGAAVLLAVARRRRAARWWYKRG